MLLDFTDLYNSNDEPLYIQLYNRIKDAVNSGVIKKGERLPSIREAASQLKVSRTTVENAYMKLCIENIAESLPQRGYYICGTAKKTIPSTTPLPKTQIAPRYNFSTQIIETSSADTNLWKKIVRSVLCDSQELTSYGDPQGEAGLRHALADYSYKARGVRTNAGNIVIGAGTGPLLNILCGLVGRNIKVGIENGGFDQAEHIFSDYGIDTVRLSSDNNGAIISDLVATDPDILFLLPSALSKLSVTALSRRRNEFLRWVKDKPEKLIIEDDYNGELRYTARTVSAFQGKNPESTVYIGSFSKLLLPSVRIAYMVLPDSLSKVFAERKKYYNQTCGKTEQLALKSYIESGALEKHLRRLRKLYYTKSQLLCSALKGNLVSLKDFTLFETSLTVKVKTHLSCDSKFICENAAQNGMIFMPSENKGEILLCFAGIAESDIKPAVKELNRLLEGIKKNTV